MELYNGEIYNAVQSLNELFEKDWPIETSLGIAKLSSSLSKEYETIEKVRTGLVKKYGKQDGKGGLAITPEDETWEEFQEAYMKLMTQQTEVVFDVVGLPSNVNGDPVMINPKTMIALDKFVKIKKEEAH